MAPDDTLSFYDDNAADYAAGTSGRFQREQRRAFANALQPGAHVLDLGAGGGHDGLWFIKEGFDVTLLDGSAGLAREAEERTGRPVRVLRFEMLDYIEAFDGIWAAASLHHVSAPTLPDVMARVAQALVPAGLLFASFKEADADWHDRFGRYFAAMSADRLRALSKEAGLAVEAIERSQGAGFDGEATVWLSLTAQRSSGKTG